MLYLYLDHMNISLFVISVIYLMNSTEMFLMEAATKLNEILCGLCKTIGLKKYLETFFSRIPLV